MTPYQLKLLHRVKLLASDTNKEGEIIGTLLEAIENRDALLKEYLHFFGPSKKESTKIQKVLDYP